MGHRNNCTHELLYSFFAGIWLHVEGALQWKMVLLLTLQKVAYIVKQMVTTSKAEQDM